MSNFSLPTLREKAMVVRFRMNRYHSSKVDRRLSHDVQAAEGTSKLTVNKKLFADCTEFKRVTKAFNAIRKYVHDNTLPWCDDGVRLIPNASYFQFAQDFAVLRSECDQAVQELVGKWDGLVQADMASFGTAANPLDYPTAEEVEQMYGVSIRFSPIPTVEDFRVDVSPDDTKAFEDEMAEAQKEATANLLEQILEPVSKMVETLGKEQKEGVRGYSGTLVTNITSVVKRARRLNIENDPRVTEVCDEADSILKGLNVRMLKDDEELTEDVREGMSEIEKKLKAWF